MGETNPEACACCLRPLAPAVPGTSLESMRLSFRRGEGRKGLRNNREQEGTGKLRAPLLLAQDSTPTYRETPACRGGRDVEATRAAGCKRGFALRLQVARKEAGFEKLGGSQTGKPAPGQKTNRGRKRISSRGVEAGRALVSRDPLVFLKDSCRQTGPGGQRCPLQSLSNL